MTHEEINKKAYEKYPAKLAVVDLKGQEPRQIDLNEEARNAYIEAYKEISALPTIKGWVARDKDGELHFWNGKPIRNDDNKWWWWSDTHQAKIPESSFPSVTWESGPKKVKIIIKAE